MPRRPYEDFLTRREVEGRIYWLVVAIGASHFYVDALEPYLSTDGITAVRVLAGTGIALATGAFETLKARRER